MPADLEDASTKKAASNALILLWGLIITTSTVVEY